MKTAFVLMCLAAAPAWGVMDMNNTLSDGAQRNTIAFDGLAFLTGSIGADSFFPPGKVADFWGFQYLRDNDPSGMGHNTDFLSKAANNMLYVLTDAQRQQLITLARSQVASINQYACDRFVLMDAFRRNLAGDLPAGTTALSRQAVLAYSQQLYHLDGQISYARAQVMGSILAGLTSSQKSYLDAMVGQGMTSWPTVANPIDRRALTHDEDVAVSTYAGDLFSWYAGNVDADVYFCPERQGTYFGSFYLKDAPAMGNPNYSIPTNLTGDYGAAFLAALTPAQAKLVTDLTAAQRADLLALVDRRREVSVELRKFIAAQAGDLDTVLDLMDQYGRNDGQIIYLYATAFAGVNATLTAAQRAALAAMRTEILQGEPSVPDGAFLYSNAIALPDIPSSDFLFGHRDGDANGDGVVDLQDFGLFKANYGATAGATWTMGDFDGNGTVDLQDFGLLKANFGLGAASSAPLAAPEPAALTVLAAGLAGLLIRPTRRNNP